ncbi:MAG: zinc-dependent peptidase [Porticoccaceae bacterium]|jgi:Mlc titration factor MtfA (ptsG expression regulator)|nr:zinc-dependent peptidase [Porticoccaceae bacterium]MEA3298723.1 zinc-dependent peptidase [Pseudomonadota bacterium]
MTLAPDPIDDFLAHNWFIHPYLSTHQRAVVLRFVRAFCAGTEFLFAPTVEASEELTWLVAANAALVGGAQRTNAFASVRWVYLVDDDDLGELSGDAFGQSTVRINAWDLVEESRQRIPGQQIAIHEFAHILDQQFGITDSTPGLRDGLELHLANRRRGLHDIVSDHVLPTIIEEGTNMEFFAYVSEAFFTDPQGVRDFHGPLYRDLAGLYGLDLASQLPPLPPGGSQ